MLMINAEDALELGEALLDAVEIMRGDAVQSVSVEVTKSKVVALAGEKGDNTLVWVVRCLSEAQEH